MGVKSFLERKGLQAIRLWGMVFCDGGVEEDARYLKVLFRYKMGKPLNLDNPKTFSEKLQWLKLYDRNPEYCTMVDKYEVKKYVSERIGAEYVFPALGIWNRFEDIDFDSLPNQFVLKCTHDSGGLVIVKDKSTMDMNATRKKINHCLKRRFFYSGREWPYKDIKPRILAEQYYEDDSHTGLRDYKFFCFDGEVKALFIATDRGVEGTETKFDFYDADFNHLPFTNGHPNADNPPVKPVGFEEMKELAAKLSKGIPQVRIDFYDIDGKVYFGEYTFSHWSGLKPFKPEKWDDIFGSWIMLPKQKKI